MIKIKQLFSKQWDELVKTIPDELEASAKEYGALERRREIKTGADLLRLVLIYAIVLSLRTTVIWAVGLGLCDISRQALEKRVHQSSQWLKYLLARLLSDLVEVSPEATGLVRRCVLRDASIIARPSSPGTEWRIHLSWSLLDLHPTQVSLTDEKEGEGLAEAGLQAGDLVVADRAYGLWRTLKVVLETTAYFIIRLTWSNLPLHTLAGQPFDLIGWLQKIPQDQQSTEISVVAANDPHKRPLRLVAGRLPPDKVRQAQEHVTKQARKKKRQPHPNTLLAAGFCLVLTNLPAPAWSALSVLAFYRLRWQIEWCFRRWKSLCQLDQLPAYPAKIAHPVLLAKLIIILLMQRQLGYLPWRQWWAAQQPPPVVSTLVTLTYNRLCEIIRPSAVIDQLLTDPTPFLRHLRSSRRKRPLQLAAAVHYFSGLLP